MRYLALALSFLFLMISGCSTYSGRPAPMPVPEMIPYSYRHNRLEIYADPYVQLDRQRKYFNAELTELGVIPIQVLIRNSNERSFSLPYAAISLELADGTQIPRSRLTTYMEEMMAVSQDELDKVAAQQKEEESSEEPSKAAKLGKATLAGALTGAIQGAMPLIIIGAPVWIPIVYAVNRYRSNQAWSDRLADYRGKELGSDIVLNKDNISQGFVFFVIPPDVKLSATANLVFSFVEENSQQPAAVKLYLKGLGSVAEKAGFGAPP